MKKRKPITLLVGVAAIAGLTGAYFGLNSHNEKVEEKALEEASGEEILSVDSNTVSKISFYINGEEETFKLDGDQWKLERDETFPVDSSQVLAPVTQLAPLLAMRILENVGDISEYGLDEPQNVITLTDTSGEEIKVTIGDTNSGTGNDYLMLGDDETVVYTVEDTLRTAFSDDLYDYAYSDEMPVLQVSEMTGASVQTGESGYELYLEEAQWMVGELAQNGTAVINGRNADNDTVNTAMSSLGSLAYADYVEHNCIDDETYGFAETGTVLTIYYQVEAADSSEEDENEDTAAETEQDGTEEETNEETETPKETRSVSFKIGTTDSLGNYYVQMVGSTEVHTLSSTSLDNFLGKTWSDFEAEEVETEMESETAAETETEMESEAAAETETEMESETAAKAGIEMESEAAATEEETE